MYTSDTNKWPAKGMGKTVWVHLALSATAIIVDNIYALFGHGVRSAAMSLMFLYPLLGGALGFFALRLAAPWARSGKGYRLGYNLYNSGIAVLTVGSFFKGILEIAGTASDHTRMFAITGWGLLAIGTIILIGAAADSRRAVRRYRER